MKIIYVIIVAVVVMTVIIVTYSAYQVAQEKGERFKSKFNEANFVKFAFGQPLETTDKILDYCLLHADRVAMGENVTQDLIISGLLSPEYANVTCASAQETHDAAMGFRDFLEAYDRCNRENC